MTRALLERRVDKAFGAALAAHSDLSNYPLRLDFDHKGRRVVLRGLCASEADSRSIADAITPDAFPYAVERDVKLVSTQDDARREATRIAQLDATLDEARAALAVLRAEQDSAPAKLHRLEGSFAVFFTTHDNLADPASAGAGLDELARLLKLSGEGVRVVGYADEVGTPELNRTISRQRTDKVVAMLVERGVPRERLVSAARATLDPIASNASGATRNRRVVFERLYEGELLAR